MTKFDPTGKSAETKLTLMKMGYLYTYSQVCVCFSNLKVMFLLCFGIVNWFFCRLFAAMPMMTSQIFDSADFAKTQKSKYLENKTLFFLQIKNSLMTH